MDKEFTIDDIKLVLRGKENFPLVYVSEIGRASCRERV